MTIQKPKGKKAKPKKQKDNVTYLAELTGDERFASPTVVLETYLDEYKRGEVKADKILVIALENDGGFSYRSHHVTTDEMILLAAKLHLIGMDAFQRVPDDE